MDKDLKRFFRPAKDIRLTAEARWANHFALMKIIEECPLRDVRNTSFDRPIYMFASLVAILLLFGGAATFAAENSLPGDFLYPVKTEITEPVRVLLSTSLAADGQLEIEFANKRLKESESLAVRGKLNSTHRANLEQRFLGHAQKIENLIVELEAKGDFQGAVNLGSSFEAVLIREKSNDDKQSLFSGENKTKQKTDTSAQANVKVAAQGQMGAAENKIREAELFITNQKPVFATQVIVDSEGRLEAARQLIVDGKQKFETGSYNEAFLIFQKAHRVAQEVKLLLKLENNLKIINIDQERKKPATEEKPKKESKDEENSGNNTEIKGAATSKTEVELETGEGNKSIKNEGGVKLELKLPGLLNP